MKIKINFIILLCMIVILTGCNFVETTIISEIENDNNIKAVLYSQGSGATTATGYVITILGKKEKFKEDADPNVLRTKIEDITMEWEDDNTLLVAFPTGDDVYQQEDEVKIDGQTIYIKYKDSKNY